MNWKTALKTSRPRFWIYLIGPAFIGAAAALTGEGHWSWLAASALLIFTLPANLFIYGVNDVFDQDTDRLNPKKQGYEQLLDPKSAQTLLKLSLLCLIPFILLFIPLPRSAMVSLAIFLFLGAFYSAPPIRAKARPFLDSLFNSLYLLPGLVAWYAFGGGVPAWSVVIAGIAWCMAMHAYSAVPDIAADRAAGIKTIATTLEKKGTLLFCAVLYLLAADLGYLFVGPITLWLGLIYLGLMLGSASAKSEGALFQVYRWFPWVNTLVGFSLFLWIVLTKWS